VVHEIVAHRVVPARSIATRSFVPTPSALETSTAVGLGWNAEHPAEAAERPARAGRERRLDDAANGGASPRPERSMSTAGRGVVQHSSLQRAAPPRRDEALELRTRDAMSAVRDLEQPLHGELLHGERAHGRTIDDARRRLASLSRRSAPVSHEAASERIAGAGGIEHLLERIGGAKKIDFS